jgi:Ubiquitin-specific protease C-terminal
LSTASVDTSYGTNFYAEPIPQEEDEVGEQDKFIIIVHFSKDFTRHHGVPVKFLMKPVSPRVNKCADSSVNYGMIQRNDYRRD